LRQHQRKARNARLGGGIVGLADQAAEQAGVRGRVEDACVVGVAGLLVGTPVRGCLQNKV
jgi:hypothetical protein